MDNFDGRKLDEISEVSKVVLLLTSPLLLNGKGENNDVLSVKEYSVLVKFLKNNGFGLSDLSSHCLDDVFLKLPENLNKDRLHRLLNRGFQLGMAFQSWRQRSIWVISCEDSFYPKKLKDRFGELAPPILYGCGDISLLDKGGLAIVGSRNINDEIKNYTKNIGLLAANAGISIISGGARGTDKSGMFGSLEGGGNALGVVAEKLADVVLRKENREGLMNKKLVLVSIYDPFSEFSVGNAMGRNKLIYAFSDKSLVVTSELNKGGTWAGAIEQLNKLNFVPVFVSGKKGVGFGNKVLMGYGGVLWPEPGNKQEFRNIIRKDIKEKLGTSQEKEVNKNLQIDIENVF